MLVRLNTDVLSKHPDWVLLSCGVNDVTHNPGGVSFEDYRSNISSIVDQAEAAGVKVMVLTATPVEHNRDIPWKTQLAECNHFLREVAAQKHCLLADVNLAMQAAFCGHARTDNLLTVDGAHMNPRGDQIMASVILSTFGLSQEQLAKARRFWMKIPGGWTMRLDYRDASFAPTPISQPVRILRVFVSMTIPQYEALDRQESKRDRTETDVINQMYAEDCKALLKPSGPYETFDAIFDGGKQDQVEAQLWQTVQDQISKQLTSLTAP
jgi:hypothetical protein